jgi:hypothetical protein
MLTHLLRAAFAVVLAGTLGLQLAHADIYTWVDASGTVNVSNLAPPEGARVTKVIHETGPKTTMRDDMAREAARQAEVQALAIRVQQLQDEVDQARRQSPVQVEYRAIPAPPALPYGAVLASQPVQYADNAVPPTGYGCDGTWAGCGVWWGPGIYPANVVVLRAPNFRHFNPVHGGHPFAARPPMHAFADSHRR